MTTIAQAILEQALRLDSLERVELIDALLRSFDRGDAGHFDTQWAQEAESRIDAYDGGKIDSASADAVLDRLAKR